MEKLYTDMRKREKVSDLDPDERSERRRRAAFNRSAMALESAVLAIKDAGDDPARGDEFGDKYLALLDDFTVSHDRQTLTETLAELTAD